MDKVELKIPTLIFGAGIAASGKTTFLGELVKYIYDAFLVDKDALQEAFLSKPFLKPVSGAEPLGNYALREEAIPKDSPHYHENVKLQSYYAMLKIAKDNLSVGKHPVLDAPYVKELRDNYLQKIAAPFFEGIKYQAKVIFCYAPEEVIKRRMQKRNSARDAAKLISEKSWRRFLEEQPVLPPELERINHLKLDTTLPLEERLNLALDYLRQ